MSDHARSPTDDTRDTDERSDAVDRFARQSNVRVTIVKASGPKA